MNSVAAWVSISLLLMPAGQDPAPAGQPRPDQAGANGSGLLGAGPLEEDAKDDELRKLQKARYNAALGEVQILTRLYQAGRADLDSVCEAEVRLVRAGLELCDTPADEVALLRRYVELAGTCEKLARARVEAARGTEAEAHRARYQRLDAEIQLLRAERKAGDAKGE